MYHITNTSTGHLAPIGPDLTVRRLMPVIGLKQVGPFVFLDHMGPMVQPPGEQTLGTGSHPHRGFITFTYLFDGELEHYDSRGHHGIVAGGGAQWMKAASGIVHDEGPSAQMMQRGGLLHGVQLWINLPAANKGDTPEYMPLTADKVPVATLPGDEGTIRVLIGRYKGLQSPIPTYSPMLAYHVQAAPGATLSIPLPAQYQVGLFIPGGTIEADFQTLSGPILVVLEGEGAIQFTNKNATIQDVLLLAGMPLGEPVMMRGPFVMNDTKGIDDAYNDYNAGKYGTINYEK